MKRLPIFVLAATAMLGTPVIAQEAANTNMEIFMQKVKADKKLLVATNMELTDAEAKAFWPLYDAYEVKMDKLDDRHAAEVNAYAEHYRTLTDEDATNKLDEVIAIKQARLDVQKEFLPKFRAALSSKRL